MRFPLLERCLIERGFFDHFIRRVFFKQMHPDRNEIHLVIPSELKARFAEVFDVMCERDLPVRPVNTNSQSDLAFRQAVVDYNSSRR